MNGAEEATFGGVFATLDVHHSGGDFCGTDAPGTALEDSVALIKKSSRVCLLVWRGWYSAGGLV